MSGTAYSVTLHDGILGVFSAQGVPKEGLQCPAGWNASGLYGSRTNTASFPGSPLTSNTGRLTVF